MKRLPEKLIMGAVILSCGVASQHLDQAKPARVEDRAGTAVLRKEPIAPQWLASVRSAKVASSVTASDQLP